jgi:hypothetical protein
VKFKCHYDCTSKQIWYKLVIENISVELVRCVPCINLYVDFVHTSTVEDYKLQKMFDTNGNSECKLQPQKGGIFFQANISINCVVIRIMTTRTLHEFKIHLFIASNEQINVAA